MTMPRSMQTLVLVTAMLSLSAFCLARDAFVFLAFVLVAAAVSGVLAQGARPRRLPTTIAHLLIGGLVVSSATSAIVAGTLLTALRSGRVRGGGAGPGSAHGGGSDR